MNRKVIRYSFIVVAYIVLLLLIAFVENRGDGSITSVWDAFWYSIVTLSTVGYGDFYPVTTIGKILGLVFIFGSLTVLSTVIGKISDGINQKREKRRMGFYGTDFENHMVIVGWNEFAGIITQDLVIAKTKVAIITNKKNELELVQAHYDSKEVFVLYSDYKDISNFAKANIEKSRFVFISLDTDMDKLVTVLNIKRVFSSLNFMVSLDHLDLQETFEAAGVSFVISKNTIASKLITSYIFEPEVAKFNVDIMATTETETDYDVQQFKVTRENPYCNKRYGEMFDELRSKTRTLPVGISKKKGNGYECDYELIKLPSDDTIINEEDYIIFINNGSSMKFITKLFKVEQGIF